MKRIKKHAEEMSTFEFLDEQLYQVALRGGYKQEWDKTKEYLPSLEKYQSSGEFMKAMWNETELREKTIRELETLWKVDYDLRPATGVILMLALWRNSIGAGDDYWGNFFINLAEGGE